MNKRLYAVLIAVSLILLLTSCKLNGRGTQLYSYEAIEEIKEKSYAYGRSEGYDEGYEEGYEDGKDDGYEEGYEHGAEEGYNKGYNTGYSDGYEVGLDN